MTTRPSFPPQLEPANDHSNVSTIRKLPLPLTLPKSRKVTDHDHCYASEREDQQQQGALDSETVNSRQLVLSHVRK